MTGKRMNYFAGVTLLASCLCTILLMTSCSDSSTSNESPPPTESSLPPQVGDKAPDFTLNTLDRNPLQLSKTLADGPVVLIVLRGWPGYQCPICTRQVGELITHADDLKAAGANLILVYPGPADLLLDHAREFVSDENLPKNFSFVIDPDYKFTFSYGLRWDALKETAYPSTFVIDPQGIVRFAKVSKSHGDRADIAEVINVLAEIK